MISLDPEQKTLELVKNLRNKFSKDLRGKNLAYSICSHLGIQLKEVSLRTNSEGHYIAGSNIVVLNTNYDYEPRSLFTLFHEITHCLIEKEGEQIIEILNDYAVSNFQESIEELCDLGSSEFLLPEEEIKDKINNENIDLNLFRALFTQIQEVSPPAIARKLAYIATYPAIFVICTPKIVLDEIGEIGEEKHVIINPLVIEYSFNTKYFKYPLKRFNPIPKAHLLNQAYQNSEDLNGDDYFPFSNQNTKMPCYIDCFSESKRVYAIIYQKKPNYNQDQLSFF